jgi:peptidoglycan hydrolase-like protein with peptidoglycan-binding domain
MNCGIAALDRLMSDASAPPIERTDREGVGAVQALLSGHGFHGMPCLLDASCGRFGPQTEAALIAFRATHGLPASGVVDAAALHALVTVPASTPVLSPAYLGFVLDLSFTGLLPIAAVTMQLEGGGRFCAANANTDRCGLSFGLIQWAQRPGRLHELLLALNTAHPDLFTRIFGGGDAELARALLTHTAKPSGGVDPGTGVTTDSRFDLVAEPWSSRFRAAGREPVFQKQQVAVAIDAFEQSLRRIRQTMPVVTSQRGLTAVLDVANQFGDSGAAAVARAVLRPGMTELEFLAALESETVARVSRQYGTASPEARSTANRRQLVRTTPWLSDLPV